MKYFKKNKWLIIPVVVFVVVMIFAVVGLINLVVPNSSKDLYGDRLDDIENYKIQEGTITLIKEDILKDTKVLEVTYDIKGKLINFIILVDENMDRVTAEALTSKIISGLDEKLREYYDLQVFIKTEEESEIFPIIGYKHTTSLNFIWTNN